MGSAGEPWVIALTGVAKLLGAAFALSYLLPALPPLSRRVRVAAGGLLAAGLVLYGVANFAGHALMLAGADDVPPALGDTALRWHAFFWDPYWLLGGVLFGLAVRRFASATRAQTILVTRRE